MRKYRYHLTEDQTGYRLTDIIEIYFLEIPKLIDSDIEKDENDPIVQWMKFLDAKSKEEMEMLAEKNKDIKKAYDLLHIISKDEKAKIRYQARLAEISDQLTRLKSAEEKGKGIKQLILKQYSKGLSVEYIAEINDFDVEYIKDVVKNSSSQKTESTQLHPFYGTNP